MLTCMREKRPWGIFKFSGRVYIEIILCGSCPEKDVHNSIYSLLSPLKNYICFVRVIKDWLLSAHTTCVKSLSKNNQPKGSAEFLPVKTGCRMNFLAGFDKGGKMSATITTSKEDIDCQFWYKGKTRWSMNTNTSRINTPGMMKKKANWYIVISPASNQINHQKFMMLEFLKRNLEAYQWFLKTIQKVKKSCIKRERKKSFQLKFLQKLHKNNLSWI